MEVFGNYSHIYEIVIPTLVTSMVAQDGPPPCYFCRQQCTGLPSKLLCCLRVYDTPHNSMARVGMVFSYICAECCIKKNLRAFLLVNYETCAWVQNYLFGLNKEIWHTSTQKIECVEHLGQMIMKALDHNYTSFLTQLGRKIHPNCAMCKKSAPVYRCGGCQVARYCCRDCRDADWKSHKPLCATILKGFFLGVFKVILK